MGSCYTNPDNHEACEIMMIWFFFLISCSTQEQPETDLSYLTISQVMPFLDITAQQNLSQKLLSFVMSKQQFCSEDIFERTVEDMMVKTISFQGDCLFDVDSDDNQKSKNIRDEQSFSHPFHEDLGVSISFPYAKPQNILPFFQDIQNHTRMEGNITISSSNINAEGFSVFQQQEDNTETLVLYIDGTITTQNHLPTLLHLEISGFFCGIFSPCESKPWLVDLRHELYIDGKEYSQITIGSITQNRSISIESSFSFDETICDLRPISGHIGIEKGMRYDITFEKNCDNCALISQQGKPSIPFCNNMP